VPYSGTRLSITTTRAVGVMLTENKWRKKHMSLFNAQGEMNGVSVKDALSTLVKYAAIIEENQPSNAALAGRPDLNNTKRDEMISKAILTQDGKVALAQAMANPIR